MKDKTEILNNISAKVYLADEYLSRFIENKGYVGRYHYNDMFIKLFEVRANIYELIKLQDNLF